MHRFYPHRALDGNSRPKFERWPARGIRLSVQGDDGTRLGYDYGMVTKEELSRRREEIIAVARRHGAGKSAFSDRWLAAMPRRIPILI